MLRSDRRRLSSYHLKNVPTRMRFTLARTISMSCKQQLNWDHTGKRGEWYEAEITIIDLAKILNDKCKVPLYKTSFTPALASEAETFANNPETGAKNRGQHILFMHIQKVIWNTICS